MPNTYPFNIPDLNDPADIQAALTEYHYGTSGGGVTVDINNSVYGNNSIARYLQAVTAELQTAQNRLAAISPLTDTLGVPINLQNTIANGVYYSPSGVTLTSLDYPVNIAGIITHVQNSTDTARLQTYQTLSNDFYLRSATKTGSSYVWGEWGRLSLSTHNHDERYYTETEIDNKIGTTVGTNAMANKVLISDANGRITSSPNVTTTELSYLSEVTSDIQEQLNLKASGTHEHNNLYYQKGETARIYVQQQQPTGTIALNALWIW